MGRRLALVGVLVAVVAGLALWLSSRTEMGEGQSDVDPTAGSVPTSVEAPGLAGRAKTGSADASASRPRPRPVPPGPSIRGRVVDRTGRGIAGAHLVAIPDDATRVVVADDAGKEGSPGYENFTDADGRFVIAASDASPFFDLLAEAPGYGHRLTEQVRAGSDVTITLATAHRLVGRVLTMEGDPIAGARVIVGMVAGFVRMERVSTSDALGRYRIEDLPASQWPRLDDPCVIVTKDGFAPLYLPGDGRATPGSDERTLDLVLVRGATLTGRVVDDANGAPVADAHVMLFSIEGMMNRVFPSGASRPNPWSPRLLAETKSGAEGTFVVQHVPATGFHRVASSSGSRSGKMLLGEVGAWKTGWTFQTAEVDVAEDGAALTAEIRLRPSASVTGRVVWDDGAAVPGARAFVASNSSGSSWVSALSTEIPRASATADGEGRYRIAAAPTTTGGGPAKLQALQPPASRVYSGLVDGKRTFEMPSVQIELRAGAEVTAPDLVFKRVADVADPAKPASAVLVVTDAKGDLVWGATAERSIRGGTEQTGRSDREGRISTAFLARNGEPIRTVIVRAPGFAPTVVELPAVTKDGEEIRLVLSRARRLSGHVLYSDRKPAARAAVTIYNGALAPADVLPPPGAQAVFGRRSKPGDPPLVLYGQAWARDDGTFGFEDLPDGPYHVVAIGERRVGPSGGPAPAIVSGVAADRTDVELTLGDDARRPSGGIRGSVVDAKTGRPVASVNVTVSATGSDLPINQPTMVRSADGSSMAHVMGPAVTERTSVGRFETSGLDPGTYDVEVRATGYVTARSNGITVGTTAVDTPPTLLSRGIRVRGVVRLPTGVAIDERTLRFVAVGPPSDRGAVFAIGSDGTYDGTGLVPGRYRIEFRADSRFGQGPAPMLRAGDEEIVLTDAPDQRVDLELALAGVLSVRVLDARFPPASWEGRTATPAQLELGNACVLTITDSSGRVVTSTTLATGVSPSLNALVQPPGSYVVRIAMPGGEELSTTVEITSGSQATATLGARPAR